MGEYEEYEVELTANREEIAAVLDGVADGIRTGAVRLGTGTDAVSIEMPEELSLEIELETGNEEMSLELELEWPASGDSSAVLPIEDASETAKKENEDAFQTGEEGSATVSEPEEESDTLVGASDGSRSLARFEVYQGKDAEWRWRLRHHNGNIIATSGEGYTRKHNAIKGLHSVMANATGATIQ